MLLKTIAAICSVVLLVLLGVFIYRFSNMSSEEEELVCGVADANNAAAINLTPEETAGEVLFNANCTPCHSITERIVGPPLKDVSKRHAPKWLVSFIQNAPQMIRNGDPEAVRVYKENNEMSMTPFTSLSEQEIISILAYIQKISGSQHP